MPDIISSNAVQHCNRGEKRFHALHAFLAGFSQSFLLAKWIAITHSQLFSKLRVIAKVPQIDCFPEVHIMVNLRRPVAVQIAALPPEASQHEPSAQNAENHDLHRRSLLPASRQTKDCSGSTSVPTAFAADGNGIDHR